VERNAAGSLWIPRTLALTFVLSSGLIACTGDERDAGTPPTLHLDRQTAEPAAAPIPCEDPRPEVCTQHYDPVCGEREDGSRETYSNACAACSDPRVGSHRAGACE
jgi:hypothetical protein